MACATNDGLRLDGHFGSCDQFMVYDVFPAGVELVGSRAAGAAETARRTAMIRDCQMVCLQAIGGPAAGRVTQAGIMPLKFTEPLPLVWVLERIRARLADHPPPWMARAMIGRQPACLEH
ncbi:MAG: hypothetical protein HQL66_07560 [Magnetococcales bacterium]|nr:hypothetical protein [Magnetococcales bacterium]